MISGTESTVRETRSLSLTKLRYRLTVWCDHVTCGMSKSRSQNLGLGLEAKILALASVSGFGIGLEVSEADGVVRQPAMSVRRS